MSYKYCQQIDGYGRILLYQISRVHVHWFISHRHIRNQRQNTP